MTQGNGATIDIHPLSVPAHLAVDPQRLGSKRLIGLDKIQIIYLPASPFETTTSRYEPYTHVGRV